MEENANKYITDMHHKKKSRDNFWLDISVQQFEIKLEDYFH